MQRAPSYFQRTETPALPESIRRELPPRFLDDAIEQIRATERENYLPKCDINVSLLSVVCYEEVTRIDSKDYLPHRDLWVAIAVASYHSYETKMRHPEIFQ